MGSVMSPNIFMLMSQLQTQNVTVFEDRVFTEVMKSVGVGPNLEGLRSL